MASSLEAAADGKGEFGAELSQHVGKGVGWIEDGEAPQQLPQSGGRVIALFKLSLLTTSHNTFHSLTSNDEF